MFGVLVGTLEYCLITMLLSGIALWEIFEYGTGINFNMNQAYGKSTVPYPAMSNSEAAEEVLRGYRLPRPEKCPEELYELMLDVGI
jgi:hypothetical protein